MDRPSHPDLLFAPVGPEQRAEALALCWPELSVGERSAQLELASVGSVQSALLGAWRGERLVSVVRVHVQAGRTATLAAPALATNEPRETAAELVRMACAVARDAGCVLLNSLVPISREADAELLGLGGLQHVADLLLLVSFSAEFPASPPRHDFELRDLREVGDTRLAQVVGRTYQGTLDVPQIDANRALKDVLAGYRAAGEFAPERWLVASRDGQDVGCLLMTGGRDLSQWELTYLGVVPEARGQGIGMQLVRHAQWMTRCAGRSRLVVAVDVLNAPALRVYEACGFIEWNRQRVFWRLL